MQSITRVRVADRKSHGKEAEEAEEEPHQVVSRALRVATYVTEVFNRLGRFPDKDRQID